MLKKKQIAQKNKNNINKDFKGHLIHKINNQ